MYTHHTETIQRVIQHFFADPEVTALLLTGSLAHGFANEGSDVDIAIIVSEAERARRAASGGLTFFSRELAGYEGGYVDAKYLSLDFLDQVERRGSEPARYAFADARVLASRVPDLVARVGRIARYPVEQQAKRISQFRAQLEAWHWYVGQAADRRNDYLMLTAATKLSLFAGRLVLAHNQMLYPYHKWFLRVLERAPAKPQGLLEAIAELTARPSREAARALYDCVLGFHDWQTGGDPWGHRFMLDTELSWMNGVAPIEDV